MTEHRSTASLDSTETTPKNAEEIDRAIKNVRFLLLQSALYHMDELWYYSFMERLILWLTTLASTAVVGTIYADHPKFALLSGVAVAALSTASLVFGFSARARLHEGLRQRYYLMISELENASPTLELVKRLHSEMARTYSDEPPIKWAVSALAWNSARASMTPRTELKKTDLLPLTLFERATRFIVPYGPERFKFAQQNTK